MSDTPKVAEEAAKAAKAGWKEFKGGLGANKAWVTVGAILGLATVANAIGLFRSNKDEQGNEIHRPGVGTTLTQGLGTAGIYKLVQGRGNDILQAAVKAGETAVKAL